MSSKETIGLAGEYAVAFELCRRGYYAQLTLGNHKKTDILVETPDKLFRVSVKAKTGNQWPKVSGIWAKGDLLVFVDFKDKTLNDLPDFYVLDVKSWKSVAEGIVASKSDGAKLNSENTVYWDPYEGQPKGWKGCSISLSHVEKYKNRWPKALSD
ncbi:hypothetical protein KIH87_12435 [Paraneptunicella aestuarii]|uniref:hypothetical protein n=1 Tax=Paraneptunicella aestuarii TaxID=2831148 RepID=UPI001E5410DC|nr:hypothetical protein [Paraneptunicella aestuarii]UAA37519.1 hypothetical protein KIH87_12435 [Paraneptunicella aestuarii]